MSSDRPPNIRATSRSLPIALLRARERVMAPIRVMLAEAGVTEQQWRVLRVLAEDGAREPKEIAERSCLFVSSLTRIVDALEARGLVRRLPNDADRRKIAIEITKAGARLIEENTPASNAIFGRVAARFGAERLDALLDLLEEFAELDLDGVEEDALG